MIKHTLSHKMLNRLTLLSFCMASSAFAIDDSTSISAPTSSTAGTCVTKFTQTSMPYFVTSNSGPFYYQFQLITAPSGGGVLCPGTYNIYAYCSVYTGGGCGAGNCGGWQYTHIYVNGGWVTQVSHHDGCGATDSDLCEYQSNVTLFFGSNVLSYDAMPVATVAINNTTPIYITMVSFYGIESGGYRSCTVRADQFSPS